MRPTEQKTEPDRANTSPETVRDEERGQDAETAREALQEAEGLHAVPYERHRVTETKE